MKLLRNILISSVFLLCYGLFIKSYFFDRFLFESIIYIFGLYISGHLFFIFYKLGKLTPMKNYQLNKKIMASVFITVVMFMIMTLATSPLMPFNNFNTSANNLVPNAKAEPNPNGYGGGL